MSLVTVTVDPDDGGADYADLDTAESTEQTNLDSANDYMEIECTAISGGDDDGLVTFDGWTTSATDYIEIITPQASRHEGSWDDGLYTIKNSSGGCIKSAEPWVHITGLQIQVTGSGNFSPAVYFSETGSSTTCYLDSCIIKGSGTFSYDYSCAAYVDSGSGAISTMVCRNNIIYDFVQNSGEFICGLQAGDGTNTSHMYLYNNTIQNCDYGVAIFDNTNLYWRNNIAVDCANTVYYSTGTIGSASGYNITDSNDPASLLAHGSTRKTGTTTGASTNKLIDSGGGLSAIPIGAFVKDSGTNYAAVTAIDSDQQLSIDTDIFSDTEAYTIYSNMEGEPTFENKGSDIFLLGSTDTLAMENGEDLSAVTHGFSNDILGVTRPK